MPSKALRSMGAVRALWRVRNADPIRSQRLWAALIVVALLSAAAASYATLVHMVSTTIHVAHPEGIDVAEAHWSEGRR